MFTITIHLQADDLSMLTPLAQHLGHIEVAIDSPVSEATPPRQPHPAVVMIDEIEREQARTTKQGMKASYRDKLQRERNRKAAVRQEQRILSPKVIDNVACPTCGATHGQPCRSAKTVFGRTGHTHWERRDRFSKLTMSQEELARS